MVWFLVYEIEVMVFEGVRVVGELWDIFLIFSLEEWE